VKNLINLLPTVNNTNLSALILPSTLIVLNFIVCDNFTWRGIGYIRATVIPLMIGRIIRESMDYVLGKSHEFFQESMSGKVANQIQSLAEGIKSIIGDTTPDFLRCSITIITSLVVSYSVNPIFCLILTIWCVLFVGISIVMYKNSILLSGKKASEESTVVGELVDSMSNQSNIRVFARKSYEILRMRPILHRYEKAYRNMCFYDLMTQCIQATLTFIMLTCSICTLIDLYGKHLITIGDFASIWGFYLYTAYITWYGMLKVQECAQEIGKCNQSLKSLMVPLEIKDKVDAVKLECSNGAITFKHVSFNYKASKPLFKNVVLEIKPKQKVGLVGYSGGGKSTFVNLILRLYDLNSGAILIDGQDITDVTQDSLRANISMIPQDTSLFNRSLMENIRYGRIEATDEEVIEAAKKAHAHDFITKLHDGYDSLVGERGVKLSGGQRQRIAIARAMLKNAPILILDEATSQLDSVTENLIQNSLLDLLQNKTTIVIAHRLSTLLSMDRIMFFDKGEIIEDGTHEELIEKNGLYKKLWDTQVGGFVVDSVDL
jgi:ATP-binding cassette subfamily B protein